MQSNCQAKAGWRQLLGAKYTLFGTFSGFPAPEDEILDESRGGHLIRTPRTGTLVHTQDMVS